MCQTKDTRQSGSDEKEDDQVCDGDLGGNESGSTRIPGVLLRAGGIQAGQVSTALASREDGIPRHDRPQTRHVHDRIIPPSLRLLTEFASMREMLRAILGAIMGKGI